MDALTEAQPPTDRISELERTCFVIMPFGEKDVGGKKVDFNAVYKNIFEPAIRAVKTPENQDLIPARTDMDAFSGSINQEMFEYIMYSRVAFADISGFNPNVFYEIGARHSAQESGTVLFRQTGHDIPFDIRTIKVFEYDHEPEDKATASQGVISRVISETLSRNRLDSPVRLALRAQWGGETKTVTPSTPATQETPFEPSPVAPGESSAALQARWNKQLVERFMRDAEEAIRLDDLDMAKSNYWSALRLDPLNIIARMRLGLVLKQQGRHYEALGEFSMVTRVAPDYGEAWKEKGVAEGLIARKIPQDVREDNAWLPDGFDSLKRATLLIPEDFDAWSSWGGVLKNVRGEPGAAYEKYAKASEISDGHPYPLLNALKIQAAHKGVLELDGEREHLEKAKKLREGQARATPPADTPWCYFDLAEIHLYLGDKASFLEQVEQGVASCTAKWQPETFRNSLRDTLGKVSNTLEGFHEGLAFLEKAIDSDRWS